MGGRPASNARLLATFLDLVGVYSPSGLEAECARYCEGALRAVGCDVAFDGSEQRTGSDTGNLVAFLPGTAPGTLVLSAHLDTVEPCKGVEARVHDGVVVSVGDTILGSDDKAGLAAAIECVRRLVSGTSPYPSVRCVFTVKEEVGLLGAKQLTREHVAGDLCLVLDAAGTPGGVVVGAPTHYTFTAEVLGRAAHAGVEPEAGVSALSIAARAVCDMPRGRLDDRTTANVGSIDGGGPTNVVAAHARVTGECRSLDRSRVEEVRRDIEAAFEHAAADHGGSVTLDWQLEYEGFQVAEDAEECLLVQAACEDAGLVARAFTTGGGSDANVIAALGVPTLALSCGMTGVHGTNEQIAVADLEALADLCVAAAYRLASRGIG